MIEISVDGSYCKGCNICMAFCPKKVFQKSKERNASGVAIPVAARAELCVACGLCERYCPDAAIRVTSTSAETGQTRAGRNA